MQEVLAIALLSMSEKQREHLIYKALRQLADKKDLKEFSSSRSDSLFWIMVVFVLCKIMTFAPLTHNFRGKAHFNQRGKFYFPGGTNFNCNEIGILLTKSLVFSRFSAILNKENDLKGLLL